MNQENKNVFPSPLSLTLVGIQFVQIGMLAFTGPLLPPGCNFRAILAGGGVVGLWGLPFRGLCQIKVFPEVPDQGKLIVLGPYRWIRHHMYTSVLLVGMDAGEPSPLPYPVVGRISDDLFGQTRVRRGPLDGMIP
ncbi:hypothetical protein ACTRXD_09010 [Nitrospira sp. T9]|uniref:hypothetical protein n=1 Tax=unclassified Nitrospira TaxID=2652172 RepID=UPI003F9DCFC4